MQRDGDSQDRQPAREIIEMPERLADQLDAFGIDEISVGQLLQRLAPPLVTTTVRGSSDCAAIHLKHVVEMRPGLPVVSSEPSVAAIHDRPVRTANAVSITISQPGRKNDIRALQSALGEGGAVAVAILNASQSPLGAVSDHVVQVGAGPETAVPASKNLVCMLVAIAAIFAARTEDEDITSALAVLPEHLDRALRDQWCSDVKKVPDTPSVFVPGRGLTRSAAMEAVLKLKETCRIHAEAFCAAEFPHGPAALPDRFILYIAFVGDDATCRELTETTKMFTDIGASAIVVGFGSNRGSGVLDTVVAAIVMIARFYQLAKMPARYRGRNPDNPSNLSKIATTL